jgi:serine/threonine-protein kinase
VPDHAEQLDRLTAALAGRYRLERKLGAGGMATVYLAEDLKHKRKVALKVLKPELAAVLGAERFVQEITTTASLQHPHILPLFDSGEAGGFLYYVMPFIEGETLRHKLDREKQLGIEEAVRITTEVADALDYAHRNAVIHRDIKPENILLHDGRPMVADFGIALAVSAAAGGRMTETGLSLGTPHYMSPEQATAEKHLTNRSDIYSLGVVLYEMLTGDPPHTGSSAQQIIMKIVTDEARLVTELRKSVPPNVAAATAKALDKLPADRFATAADFARALATPEFTLPSTTSAALVGPRDRWRTRFFAAAGAAAVFLALALVITLRSPRGVAITSYDVGLPDTAGIFWGDFPLGLSVSPNGEFVVYVARRDSTKELWYRSLTDQVSRPIPGTVGAFLPMVSPSGDRIAFQANRALRLIPVEGGAQTTIAETAFGIARWTSDTRIMLSDGDGINLRWLDVTGRVLGSYSTTYCIMAEPLPDGEKLLCGGGATKAAYVIDPGTDSLVSVMPASEGDTVGAHVRGGLRGSHFRVIDGEYLVYVSITGELRATTIDLERHRVGRSVSLIPAVRRAAYFGSGQYDLSATGTLVYAPGANAEIGHLVRYRPTVGLDTLPASPAAYLRYDMSRDGRWLAAAVEGVQEQELHIIDLSTGRSQVFLTHEYVGHPVWDASATTVTVDLGDSLVVRGSPTASGAPDTLLETSFRPSSYVSDDVVFGADRKTGAIALLDLSARPPRMDTLAARGGFVTMSPDRQWVAYNSMDLTRLFVSPSSDTRTRYQIAVDHEDAQWLSPSQLVFSGYGNVHTFKVVTIDPTADPPVGDVRTWYSDSLFTSTPGRTYTVTPDGGVVYVQGPARRTGAYLRVIPNWVEQMKRAVDEANR